MLSAQSNMCLRKEIEFLRQDLDRLYLELGLHYGVQPFYPIIHDPTVAKMIEKKRNLFNWKKTRLEALETFSHAQLVITEMEQTLEIGNIQRTFNITRRWKRRQLRDKTVPSACAGADPQLGSAHNLTLNGNKEIKILATKPAIQSKEVQNIKTEYDTKENIAQSIAEALETLRKEKVDPDEHDRSVLNSHINADFIPQLMPASNKKAENDCSVKNAGRKRKRKTAAQKKRAKRAKTQAAVASASSPSSAVFSLDVVGCP